MKRSTKPFRIRRAVSFGDTDPGGTVYYPRFLNYLHVAMEEFFAAEMGLEYVELFNKYGLALPTVHLETDFKIPLHFGDHIEIEVRALHLGRTSITWGYTVYRSGETDSVAASACNVVVTMNRERFDKTEVPDWLREKITAYQKICGENEVV